MSKTLLSLLRFNQLPVSRVLGNLNPYGRVRRLPGVADPPIFAHCKKKATSSLIAVARPRMIKGWEDVCMVSHRISASHFVN
jgi:hypothetical protein